LYFGAKLCDSRSHLKALSVEFGHFVFYIDVNTTKHSLFVAMGNTDSKTHLESSFTRLTSESIADQDAVWSSFWQLPASAEIVFNTFNGNDLHDLRSKQPGNYATLIRKVNITFISVQ